MGLLLGWVDLTIDFAQRILPVEFKVVVEQATGDTLAQLKARNYAAKYQASGKAVFLVGIEFSQVDRQIVGFEWERV